MTRSEAKARKTLCAKLSKPCGQPLYHSGEHVATCIVPYGTEHDHEANLSYTHEDQEAEGVTIADVDYWVAQAQALDAIEAIANEPGASAADVAEVVYSALKAAGRKYPD